MYLLLYLYLHHTTLSAAPAVFYLTYCSYIYLTRSFFSATSSLYVYLDHLILDVRGGAHINNIFCFVNSLFVCFYNDLWWVAFHLMVAVVLLLI